MNLCQTPQVSEETECPGYSMPPETREQCQAEIDHLRRDEPDFDELLVDAIDPDTREVVARLYLQFRSPFRSRRQEGYAMTHQDPAKPQKWQYNYSMDENDPAQVLHAFNSKYRAMKLELFLSSSRQHEKMRDAQLRRRAEQAADQDAGRTH